MFPIQSLTGSGSLVTEEYDLDGFTAVRAGSAFNVMITQGDEYSVQVTADDNLGENLVVETRGDALVLELRQPTLIFRNVTLRADITMPTLEAVDVSGAPTGTFTGFSTDGEFQAQASGASTIEGDIEANDVRVDASGASNVILSGSTQTLDVQASGASRADLSDLTAVDVRADSSGASTVRVNVSGELDADASGASTVEFSGNPTRVREDESGASTIREID
jgi:hypothetical protein